MVAGDISYENYQMQLADYNSQLKKNVDFTPGGTGGGAKGFLATRNAPGC